MRRALITLLLISLALAGCASNTKTVRVDYKDPATGKIAKTETTTTSLTDTATQGQQQVDYAKMLAKHKILKLTAADTTTITELYQLDQSGKPVLDSNGQPIVVGKRIVKGYASIELKGVKSMEVAVPLPGWKQVEEAYVKALRELKGALFQFITLGLLPIGDSGSHDSYQVSTTGNQAPINVRGKQTPMGSNVQNWGEGNATGGSMSTTDSSQQNRGDSRGFGDVGSIF
jgi:hypothetical protein